MHFILRFVTLCYAVLDRFVTFHCAILSFSVAFFSSFSFLFTPAHPLSPPPRKSKDTRRTRELWRQQSLDDGMKISQMTPSLMPTRKMFIGVNCEFNAHH